MDLHTERMVTAAREVLKAHGYFVDNLWHIDDINFLCGQLGYRRISAPEAQAVFALANDRFDGEFGICWPQLERALVSYMEQKAAPCRGRAENKEAVKG